LRLTNQTVTLKEKWGSDPYFSKWVTDVLNYKSDRTQRLYLKDFDTFLILSKYTPENLFNDYRDQLENPKPLTSGKVQGVLKSVMEQEENRGLSKNTTVGIYKAVRSYFSTFGESLRVPFKLRKEAVKLVPYKPASIYAKTEQIRRIIKNTSPRNIALVMVLKETGLRRSDVVNLRVSEIRDCIIAEVSFCHITVYTRKEGVNAYTSLGEEALNAVREYLEFRDRKGLDSEYLFVNLEGSKKNQKLHPASVGAIFAHLQETTGIDNLTPHSLRRFCINTLIASGMASEYVNYHVGKTVKESAYIDPRDTHSEFVKHYDSLRVFKPSVDTDRVNSLELNQRAYEARIKSLEADNKRMMDHTRMTNELFLQANTTTSEDRFKVPAILEMLEFYKGFSVEELKTINAKLAEVVIPMMAKKLEDEG